LPEFEILPESGILPKSECWKARFVRFVPPTKPTRPPLQKPLTMWVYACLCIVVVCDSGEGGGGVLEGRGEFDPSHALEDVEMNLIF
jgi:hypothetical protein